MNLIKIGQSVRGIVKFKIFNESDSRWRLLLFDETVPKVRLLFAEQVAGSRLWSGSNEGKIVGSVGAEVADQRWIGRLEVQQVVVGAAAGGRYGLGFGRLKKGFKFGNIGVTV
ncbi:hypothetical protein Acr_23g0005310 [Actinidia rufa]|uniref:Uncharacterized protein n=1 Tax=Actinidia rufa TaxID=165716 RepID=A0A7J0GMV3_9ERIC|nr:hypothetical protein Acr_23g0005310 [Actinidia rufa]